MFALRLVTCLLLGLAAVISAQAAEVRLADLAVIAETQPTAVDWQWDDQLGSRQGSGQLDSAVAAGVGLRWGWGMAGRPHLLTASTDLRWTHASWDGAVIEGAVLRVGVGYARALSDQWLVSAGPTLAFGRQRFTRTSAVSGDLSMDGTVVEAGIAAGVRWSLGGNWSVGADAGWQIERTRLAGDGATLALAGKGLRFGVSVAFTIDPQPRLLE